MTELNHGNAAAMSRLRRSVECGVFVAVWMVLGFTLRLDANSYLLLGFPLTVLFQLFVRRAAIRALWVRDAPPFRLGRLGVLFAAALAVYPLYLMWGAVRQQAAWPQIGILAAACGSVCVAFAARYFRRDAARWLGWCLLTAGGVAVALMLGGALGPLVRQPPWEALRIGGGSFLLYLPIVFVIEEVTFRGAIDSHAHHPGERHGVWSAVYVSALWGLWHLPMAEPGSLLANVGQLLLLHIPVGVFLSIFWR